MINPLPILSRNPVRTQLGTYEIVGSCPTIPELAVTQVLRFEHLSPREISFLRSTWPYPDHISLISVGQRDTWNMMLLRSACVAHHVRKYYLPSFLTNFLPHWPTLPCLKGYQSGEVGSLLTLYRCQGWVSTSGTLWR